VHTLLSIEIRVDFYEIFAVFNVAADREHQELVATTIAGELENFIWDC
jgi:hypothetical protein